MLLLGFASTVLAVAGTTASQSAHLRARYAITNTPNILKRVENGGACGPGAGYCNEGLCCSQNVRSLSLPSLIMLLTFVDRVFTELGEHTARLQGANSPTAQHVTGTSCPTDPTLPRRRDTNSAMFHTASILPLALPPAPWRSPLMTDHTTTPTIFSTSWEETEFPSPSSSLV